GAATRIFAGIPMLCRPPGALILLTLMAWSRLVRRDPPKVAANMIVSASGVLLFGLLLDSGFYGHFAPTTWNYINLGLVGDPAHRFDELPWYYYPPWIVKYAIPPIGALILLAFVLVLWKRPSHPIVWCALPYIVVHSIIAHKELRFLYPLALLVPWLLVEAWGIMKTLTTSRSWWPALAIVLALFNVLGLGVVITSSAGEGRVRLAQVLHREGAPGDRIGYVVPPALLWHIELPAFYAPPGAEQVVIDPSTPSLGMEDLDFVVVQDGTPLPEGLNALLPVERTEPGWSTVLMHWYTWDEGRPPWTLYRVTR
ncbi:MAG: hypothetical protein ACO1NQ_08080, partial [Flavobacteriales bacterium]